MPHAGFRVAGSKRGAIRQMRKDKPGWEKRRSKCCCRKQSFVDRVLEQGDAGCCCRSSSSSSCCGSSGSCGSGSSSSGSSRSLLFGSGGWRCSACSSTILRLVCCSFFLLAHETHRLRCTDSRKPAPCLAGVPPLFRIQVRREAGGRTEREESRKPRSVDRFSETRS
uniref:Uncharacterized protein n=1 Tax=Eimeria tenella TaxID=5802 RepID=H9B991_EIMTE|nr:hypothetical protein [Eimeria tenella]